MEYILIMEYVGQPSLTRIKRIFLFLLVTLGAYILSTILLFYLEMKGVDYFPRQIASVPKKAFKSGKTKTFDQYSAILDRNLFSVVVDETAVSPEKDLIHQIDQLELTSLNCTLIGTIVNKNGTSWAIIKDNQSGVQDKYSVGSVINGAKVVLILRNKVVLNIDGKDQLLVMGIEKIRSEMESGKEKGGPEKGVEAYKISRDFMRNSLNNISRIMAEVRVKPHFTKGKPDGFVVSRIQKGSILKTMGFRDNDIIRGVNGHPIRSAEDVMKLYNLLKGSDFFSIEILRQGKPKTLNFKVR
ncbi:MAG: hypothetical protein JRH13_10840 [Deltaproteobacteria bacterium]|nr:hypothetical protein [Deltaproteobacteria bacterium]MBW2129847.1 hypothetical protein [Deltaproteobacteria bacterium]MBW2304107.1 hypothetical protein [Deltaproteobacteria bacterium]